MSLLSVYYGSKKVVMTQSNKYRHQFEVNDLTSSFETFCGFAGRDEKISTYQLRSKPTFQVLGEGSFGKHYDRQLFQSVSDAMKCLL